MAFRAASVALVVLSVSVASARTHVRHRETPRTRAVVAEPVPMPVTETSDAWRVVTHPASARVLRGDWENPDAVVVTFTPYWAEALGVLVRGAAATTPVIMLTSRHDDVASVRAFTRAWGVDDGRVQVVGSSAETPWVRDYGPLQVFDGGELTWLDFAYETTRLGDDVVPQALANEERVPVETLARAFDGGAVVASGTGLCAITDRSLAFAGVDMKHPATAAWVSERLGCSTLAVIPGLAAEPTGHADMLAQFFAPDRLGVGSLDPEQFSEEAAALDASADVIATAAASAGMPLTIVRVPMFIDADGVYFSYLNGARIGRRFFVPAYAQVDPQLQARAYARLTQLLGDDPLVRVPADAIARLGGAIHCVTLGLSLY